MTTQSKSDLIRSLPRNLTNPQIVEQLHKRGIKVDVGYVSKIRKTLSTATPARKRARTGIKAPRAAAPRMGGRVGTVVGVPPALGLTGLSTDILIGMAIGRSDVDDVLSKVTAAKRALG